MDEFMSKLGMKSAKMALLTGCSAGGLASILHCDEFRALFPSSTYVKCLADAGFFLDVLDVAGRDSIKAMFQGVVDLQMRIMDVMERKFPEEQTVEKSEGESAKKSMPELDPELMEVSGKGKVWKAEAVSEKEAGNATNKKKDLEMAIDLDDEDISGLMNRAAVYF